MNIYKYTITRLDNTEGPKFVYVLNDKPIDGKILICMDAGIRASDFHLYGVNVSIEAVQWNGENSQDIANFLGEAMYGEWVSTISIITAEGEAEASFGDYITKVANG